ncbi:aromatic ring-hydroxylating dioxygenase subunit alpha [Streptomyces sp. NPDC051018]|uniref:aromatic ring-hydroxylating dioxygenase subunit alpha n=1 Tax=Streptomyces sp. NPDC051018 TaxID=3365639 RepID=UPI0037B71965
MTAPVLTAEEAGATCRPLDEARYLPGRVYHDEEIYAAEVERIFLREWVAVFAAAKLASVGNYTTMDLAGKPLVFVRDTSGAVRCYINVCRHRGNEVAEGSGNAGFFRCGYHRWTYDLDGEVTHAPLMPEFANCGVRLTEVRTEVWQGIVFVNFDRDAAGLGSRLGRIDAALRPWRADELVMMYERPYQCDWNWKIMFENGIESYHILGTHRASIEASVPAKISYGDPGDGENYSESHYPYANETPTGSDADALYLHPEDAGIPPIADLPGWASEKLVFWAVYPNLILNQRVDGLQAYITLPHGPRESTFTWFYLTHPSATASPGYDKFRHSEEGFADLIQEEDERCTRPVQKSMESGEYIPGPYNQRELPIWALHQWWVHRMVDNAPTTGRW